MNARGKVIGLTGTLASGKSTVLQLFGERGWSCVSADQLVHQILEEDLGVKECLVERWGDNVLAGEKLDRGRIAEMIFSDPEERLYVESLLHPRVRERWQAAVAENPHLNWVVEVPLLFEKELSGLFDATVSVSISAETQWDRALSRGTSQKLLKERIAQQMSNEEKNQRATFVISNEGTELFLEEQVSVLVEKLEGLPFRNDL